MAEATAPEKTSWLDIYQCPGCGGSLRKNPGDWACAVCQTRFPVRKGVPVLGLKASTSPGFVGVLKRHHGNPDDFIDAAEKRAKKRRIAIPRLHNQHLDGEFRDQERADFMSFPQLVVPIPTWVAPAARFQYRFKERYGRLYHVIRWIYRLPLGLFERLGSASRRGGDERE